MPNKLGILLISLAFVLMSAETAFGTRALASDARPSLDLVQRAKGLVDQGKIDESVKLLAQAIEKESDKEKRGLLRMTLGLILFRQARDLEAEEQLKKAIEDGIRISDYASYHLGLLYKKKGAHAEAIKELEKVVSGVAPQKADYQARMQIGEILMEQKQWRAAAQHLEKLKRSMRSSPHYPDIVYQLMRANLKSGQSTNTCRYARELYSKFPAYPGIRAWGATLERNTVDDTRVGCVASHRDLKTRVRRFWLSGEAERASTELRDLRRALVGENEEETSSVDYMLANHLLSEGQIEEALKLLLKNYQSKRNSVNYLMLLGKATSRAGEYQASIAAYQRAYEISPRGSAGANALFTAAFTSYQIQDYDGATRRFTEFVRKFSGSKLARDSKWYLAWMKYLKADYEGAHESFSVLAKAPKSRRRKGGEVLTADRLKYWSAVSLMKMNRTQEAIPIFQSLVRDPAIGYYAVVSYYRLMSIPGARLPAGVEAHLGMKKVDAPPSAAPTAEEMQAVAEAVEAAREEFENQQVAADSTDADTATDEESGAVENADGSGSEVAEKETAESVEASEVDWTGFKDANLASRFERARDLSFVGLEDAARSELREIEKRARTAKDRRTLMSEYTQVGNYDRSSYMGEVGFGAQRIRGGLKGESRQLWEYAYPRAYENAVVTASKSTSVPQELIWGIMRAESHFKYDAQSPVGALGLMQMMPFTGRQVAGLLNLNTFEVNSLLDPETNIRMGSRYLQRLLEKFSGSVPLVAASYNAGPHRAHAWIRNFGSLDMDAFIEHIPFVETRNYVKKVSRNYQVYSLLYGNGRHSLKWLVQPVGVRLMDPAPTKEIW